MQRSHGWKFPFYVVRDPFCLKLAQSYNCETRLCNEVYPHKLISVQKGLQLFISSHLSHNSIPLCVASFQDKANKRRMLMAIDRRTKLLKNLRLVRHDAFEKVCEQLGITYTFPPEYYRRATRRWLAKKAFCIKVEAKHPIIVFASLLLSKIMYAFFSPLVAYKVIIRRCISKYIKLVEIYCILSQRETFTPI